MTTTATYDLAELQKETRMGAMGSETASREIRRIDLSHFAQRKTEIADEAPSLEVELHHAVLGIEHEVLQTLHGRSVRITENSLHLFRVVLLVVVDHRMPKIVLAFEVVIERPFGYTHAFEHFLDARDLKPPLGQELGATPNQRPAGVRSGCGTQSPLGFHCRQWGRVTGEHAKSFAFQRLNT